MAGSTRRERGNKNPAKKGGRAKERADPQEARMVDISKSLTYVLRHGANTEGIAIDEGGWISVADVLAWRKLANLSVTLAEIHSLVSTSDKQRFSLKPDPTYHLHPTTPGSPHAAASTSTQPTLQPDDPAAYLIRASQGHSMSTISDELLLEQLSPSDPATPRWVVHGTYLAAWARIMASGGLKPMSRTHIHFATSLPSKLPPLDPAHPKKVPLVDEENQKGVEVVLSGMRRDATVMVWVDVIRSAVEGGVKWWRSSNGVVLTNGVDGLLDLKWVGWAERRGTEEVLYGDKPPGGAAGLGVRPGDGVEKATVIQADHGVEEAFEKVALSETRNGHGSSGEEIKDQLEVEDEGEERAKLKDNWDD